jgi:peptidoglycan/LPS O-acetylase OafA/YrhL
MVLGSSLFLAVSVAVNLGVAAASFHFIEAPILRLKERFRYSAAVSDSPKLGPGSIQLESPKGGAGVAVRKS